ncbi:hypothetical protein VRRI112168_03775 [Vreelandella rituensis]|uniref:Uncharacterized protein n=1 Tax=Vreelandella rituensis TaxID=2282306 RepID=A0A368U979_9GAMM|nr:hypothetical protein [Halomonas rituensis]RCV93769.1 hypothetical protein DU506_01030 [Halomonas rituensis]
MNIQSPVDFFHAHLGQYLVPDASPRNSTAPSLPTRTKAAREAGLAAADLPVKRVGTGMPVYYIVTPSHAWFLSNTAAPSSERVTAVRIDDDEGRAAIKGNQYLAHWLYHEAPLDQPFLIGNVEKASPIAAMAISLPPTRIIFCTTGKYGRLVLNLLDFREDVATVRASGIPWETLRKANLLKEKVRQSAKGILAPQEEVTARKEIGKLRKKHPELLATLKALHAKPGSGEATLLHWFFQEGNYYGQVIKAAQQAAS